MEVVHYEMGVEKEEYEEAMVMLRKLISFNVLKSCPVLLVLLKNWGNCFHFESVPAIGTQGPILSVKPNKRFKDELITACAIYRDLDGIGNGAQKTLAR